MHDRVAAVRGAARRRRGVPDHAYAGRPRSTARAVRQRLVAVSEGRGARDHGRGDSRQRALAVLERLRAGGEAARPHVRPGRQRRQRPGRYGVARALCNQLFALAPERRAARACSHRPVLAHVLDPHLAGAEPRRRAADRQQLLAALRDFMSRRALASRSGRSRSTMPIASTRRRPACWSRSLTRRTPRVVSGPHHGHRGRGQRRARRAAPHGRTHELPPLKEEQTEQLIAVRYSATSSTPARSRAGCIRSRAGNPRAILQLATHLVEQSTVRYEAGTFVLPDRLLEDDLPRSLGDALRRRLEALEPDALELARVLSLTDPRELPTAATPSSPSHGDRGAPSARSTGWCARSCWRRGRALPARRQCLARRARRESQRRAERMRSTRACRRCSRRSERSTAARFT